MDRVESMAVVPTAQTATETRARSTRLTLRCLRAPIPLYLLFHPRNSAKAGHVLVTRLPDHRSVAPLCGQLWSSVRSPPPPSSSLLLLLAPPARPLSCAD
jgi:hypothetical protein